MTCLLERERERERERDISLILRPFPAVNAVIFCRERRREAEKATTLSNKEHSW